ncbi:MAG TPA: hypothetical protein VIX89_15605 [Bryobacteraceae bacterium]
MRKRLSINALLLFYGLLSAAFYCSLLPLWEGFDEFYHYGYVQHISTTWSIPVIWRTPISRELWDSLDFAPVSHFLQPYFQRPSTKFEDYFRLPAEQRISQRRALDSIPPARQREPSPRDNYEAKQSPLSYFLLAPFDRLLTTASLSTRVLTLRLLLSLGSMLLLWIGARGLARRLALSGVLESAALFVILCCQMLYGATCHIANDALLIPWTVFFLNAVIDSFAAPTYRRTALVAILMAAGLLIKASLLVFLPLALLIRRAWLSAAILTVLAGPWYLRNLLLYHNVTGTVDTTAGVGPAELVRAAVAIPWRTSIAAMAHTALWTGNNSFTTFSASTLNMILALLALAGILYAFRLRRTTAELVTLAGIALGCIGLALVTVFFFYATKGAITAAMPWYMQILLAPVVLLCFLGLSRWNRWGRWIAMATIVLWTYFAATSWVAKLVPLYGGFEDAHARPRQLLAWYLHDAGMRDSILGTLCPAPLPLLYFLFFGLLSTLPLAAVLLLRQLARGNSHFHS